MKSWFSFPQISVFVASISLPWAICVTLLYWITIFDPHKVKKDPSWMGWTLDISQHALNFVIVLIEAIIGGDSLEAFFFLLTSFSLEY